ncbi:MAG: ABC transporter ATP-binding protein [Parasporobacterium sp.]|nr:ABC transporter ATP-binding protein [Parasporobacterium sp.]
MAQNTVINHYDKKSTGDASSRIFALVGREKGKIVTGTVLSVIGTLLTLAAPLVLMFLSQEILNFTTTGNMDWGLIGGLAAIAAVCFALGGFFQCMQTFIVAGVVARGTQHLRNQMTVKINRLPLNYFDTRNTGDVLSYLTNDVDILGATLNQTLSTLISSFVTVLGVLIILFVLDWRIALIAVILLPIVLIILSKVTGASEQHFHTRSTLTASVSAQAEESYTGFNILRVFNASGRNLEKFAAKNYDLEKAMSKADYYSGISIPLMTFFGNIMFVVIAFVGGIIVAEIAKSSGSTPEQINTYIAITIAAVSYADQLVSPITQIATGLATLQQTKAAAARIYEFLGEENEPDESHKTKTLDKIEGNISFEHVRFGYNKDQVIVHDFSEIGKPGQKIAIVGPTGAGKTTMVNLLMRFYETNSGAIKIEGVDTKEMKRGYVRSLFGMVLQDTWLFEGTIMENLKYSRPDATDEEVYEACRATHCDGFIRQQPGGYNAILNDECGLANGQKQLLTIARAMVQNAPMMILDEATSSVDTRTELLIQEAMDNLMKGRTSFIIAHRLSTIKNSDLIIVMKDGDVLETGNHDELMKLDGFYAALYNSQFTGKGPQFS